MWRPRSLPRKRNDNIVNPTWHRSRVYVPNIVAIPPRSLPHVTIRCTSVCRGEEGVFSSFLYNQPRPGLRGGSGLVCTFSLFTHQWRLPAAKRLKLRHQGVTFITRGSFVFLAVHCEKAFYWLSRSRGEGVGEVVGGGFGNMHRRWKDSNLCGPHIGHVEPGVKNAGNT